MNCRDINGGEGCPWYRTGPGERCLKGWIAGCPANEEPGEENEDGEEEEEDER
jgi:hypothetical protein